MPSLENRNNSQPKWRVAVSTRNISHFEAPFLRALAANPFVDLTVYYYNDIGVTPRFDSLYGRVIDWGVSVDAGFRSRFFQHKRELVGALLREKYDILLLYGYAGVTQLSVMLAARMVGTRVIFRGTGTRLDPEPLLKNILKRAALLAIFSQCSAFLIGGKYNADYYRYYGVSEHKMFFVPFSVDLEHFERESAKWRDKRDMARSELGLSQHCVALFVGTLTAKKGPDVFLRAAERCIAEKADVSFLMVGDGAMRSDLERYVTEHNLEAVVKFTGFVTQQELPRLYAIVDFVAFPSRYQETWARAINEAMACGLPIIASHRVGATGDIVQDKINGFVVDVDDSDSLANAMLRLCRDVDLRIKMGIASREIIAEWDYRKHIPAVLDAIRFVLST